MWLSALCLSAILSMQAITTTRALKITRQYETKNFTVPLDHFSFARNETFDIRYLVNKTYWNHLDGPIFFYTGNEGQIELFAEHTGFMWDIAEEFEAMIVFAEHRYYGHSMPFGDKSFENKNIGYMTSSQALADYADLIDFLQGHENNPKYPVIAFGGSYGGMLSAYIRMKYPHLVTGAIAASAPIHMFQGMVPCDAFNILVTSDFSQGNENCVPNIKRSWSVLRNITKTDEGKKWISKEWQLCKNVTNETDVQNLVDNLASVYTNLAMVNYPYECDFLMPLPANPVKASCEFLKDPLDGKPLLEAVGRVIKLYNNYTNTAKCIDFEGDTYGNLDAAGWDYQACTEMYMPMCSTGTTDMFEPLDAETSWKEYKSNCMKKYNVTPSRRLAYVEYGGNNIEAASNIVLSNGLLDPWASGGVLNTISDSVKAILIAEGAHHIDLMPANENDPFTVVVARNIHKDNIRNWIQAFYFSKMYERN